MAAAWAWRLQHEVAGQKTGRRAARAHQGFAVLGGRALPQRAPGHSGPARRERVDADDQRFSVWRRAALSAGAAALDEPARSVEQGARQRTARHLARPFHGADRDRWPSHIYRYGLGTARVAIAAPPPP